MSLIDAEVETCMANICPIIDGNQIPGVLTTALFWAPPYWRIIHHVPKSPTDASQGWKLAYQTTTDASSIGALPLASIVSLLVYFFGVGGHLQPVIWGLATATWLFGRPFSQQRKSESWATWLGFEKAPNAKISNLKDLTRLEQMWVWACDGVDLALKALDRQQETAW